MTSVPHLEDLKRHDYSQGASRGFVSPSCLSVSSTTDTGHFQNKYFYVYGCCPHRPEEGTGTLELELTESSEPQVGPRN